jgi:hypothetical protein
MHVWKLTFSINQCNARLSIAGGGRKSALWPVSAAELAKWELISRRHTSQAHWRTAVSDSSGHMSAIAAVHNHGHHLAGELRHPAAREASLARAGKRQAALGSPVARLAVLLRRQREHVPLAVQDIHRCQPRCRLVAICRSVEGAGLKVRLLRQRRCMPELLGTARSLLWLGSCRGS